MSFSLYDATVPTFVQALPAISGCIDKAEDWCRENGVAPSELIEARLAPDMWDFAAQIRSVAAHSGGAIASAQSGEAGPDLTPAPADFAGLRALLTGALAKVSATDRAAIDGLSGDVVFRFGERRMDFTVENWLTSFALPNFHFHASMAYAILRMKGVPVGKMNFLGQVRIKPPA